MINIFNFKKNEPESVYFYTLHKCASTLFSNFVLKNLQGLNHVDYASRIYNGEITGENLSFERSGKIYGPIRISANQESPVWENLVFSTMNDEFIRDKKAIFFIRDPRDILVSSYYSFGFTHGLSRVEKIRKMQKRERVAIQEQTLDEYVLASTDQQIKHFNGICHLSGVCKESVVIKYEDMIDDFDKFIFQFCSFVSMNKSVVEQIYDKSRPREKEDIVSHRRSGRTGDYKEKLEKETVEKLNEKLEDILDLFEYRK